MSFKTIVHWDEESFHTAPGSTGEFDDDDHLLMKMINSKLTNGLSYPDPTHQGIIRIWRTKEAAETWANFLNARPIPPKSIVIVEEQD